MQRPKGKKSNNAWIKALVLYAAIAAVVQYFFQDRFVSFAHSGVDVSAYVLGASTMLWASGLVLMLAVITLVSLRRSVHQQKALEEASKEQEKLKDEHRQVVESLPLGLFTFRDGHFQFTNWTWDEQTMRGPAEDKMKAFVKALHPTYQKQVPEALHAFEKRQEPFQVKFQLLSEFGEVRHIESTGVPMYDSSGEFQHLLAFNLDVTKQAEAQAALEAKHELTEWNNHKLEKALSDLEDNLQAMVRSLVKAIEAKDPYTAGHSERVMEYSVKIGRAMGLNEHDLKVLRMGTLIHDIGKIGVPDEILTKPEGLNEEEYDIIKVHPEVGFNMIRDIPHFAECAPIVRWHHERLDGQGYPDGIAGDEIPMLVRIATVADMFDAMTSTRAYRKPLSETAALRELEREVEKSVDGSAVEALRRVLQRESMLGLGTHRKAA